MQLHKYCLNCLIFIKWPEYCWNNNSKGLGNKFSNYFYIIWIMKWRPVIICINTVFMKFLTLFHFKETWIFPSIPLEVRYNRFFDSYNWLQPSSPFKKSKKLQFSYRESYNNLIQKIDNLSCGEKPHLNTEWWVDWVQIMMW